MMREEFIKKAGQQVSAEKYKVIETVYMNYDSRLTQDIAASLYKTFGMKIFNDLLPRAQKIEELETQIGLQQQQIESLKQGLRAISDGDE